MSTRKSSAFYGVLIALASLVAGMVIASRLGMTPASLAGPLNVPTTNSAPLSGTIDAATFRNIAHEAGPERRQHPRTTSKREARGVMDLFNSIVPSAVAAPPRPAPGQMEYQEGAGSGFIIDKAATS
jgi:hypothetical protein